jgi:hypothetical protein
MRSVKRTHRALLDERIEDGKKIDPATAQVYWELVNMLDPYEFGFLRLHIPEEIDCVGEVCFACAPGGIPVALRDLPEETRKAVEERLERGFYDVPHETELNYDKRRS